MNRTLILGSGGFLGSNFADFIGSNAFFHTTKKSDSQGENFLVSNFLKDGIEPLVKYIIENNITHIINCVALASIDECEKKPPVAFQLNSDLPKELAKISKKFQIKLVHISTDAVFDGMTQFNTELDFPNPKTVYGISKLEGENNILEENPHSIIVRVNFFGHKSEGNSLFDFFLQNLIKSNPIQGYTDIHFTTLYVRETVRIICELIDRNLEGIIHVVGNDRISKYEFGRLVAKVWGFNESLILEGIYGKSGKIPNRPRDLSLSNKKLLELGISVQSLLESLSELRTTMKFKVK